MQKFFNAELLNRVKSISIILPLILFIIYLGGYLYDLMILMFAVLMAYEWSEITSKATSKIWKFLGIFYITIPCLSLIVIMKNEHGFLLTLNMLVIIWATDIGGYVFGKIIGGKKLAPEISPNKTWAGFFGGIFMAIIFGYWIGQFGLFSLIFISIIAQISDLLESKVKRIFNVKDSGNIIPGHGGIIDMVDGVILVAPTVLLIKVIF